MPNTEAKLFTTLKALADVTKVTMVQNLNTAIASGEVSLDEKTLHKVTSIFSGCVDASIDTYHGQILRVVPGNETPKKTTKRKTTK